MLFYSFAYVHILVYVQMNQPEVLEIFNFVVLSLFVMSDCTNWKAEDF